MPLTKEFKLIWSCLTLLRLLTQYHTDVFCTNLIGTVSVKTLTHNWISTFLTNCTQNVVINNTVSSLCNVISGVPQGTVLGPILFLIYINDLPDCIRHSTIRLFADDCIIYRPIASLNDSILLQQDLDALYSWTETWLMRLNTSKCHVMNVTQARSHKIISSYKLNHSNLTSVDHCKYLGVTIQNNLKWNQHILNISVKANRTLALLRRNLKQATEVIKERAYLHLDDKSNMLPQYGAHGLNITSLHSRKFNDVLPDLLNMIMALQLVSLD